jgi:nucleotide-binding universal stress UspA family protein
MISFRHKSSAEPVETSGIVAPEARWERLLVAIDFCASSASALQQALRISRRMDAKLIPIHVLDPLVYAELAESNLADKCRVFPQVQTQWQEFLRGIDQSDAPDIELEIDNIAEAIIRRAQTYSVDLMVLGAYGVSEPKQLGHVVQVCLDQAASSVFVVKPEHRGPFQSVVACVKNNLPASATVLSSAVEFAAADHARLHVLNVFEGPWRQWHYRAPTLEASPDFRKQYVDGLKQQLCDFAGLVTREHQDYPRKCTVLDNHDVQGAIVAFAKSVEADLVILGLRKRTRLHRLISESMAEHVAHETPASVAGIIAGPR